MGEFPEVHQSYPSLCSRALVLSPLELGHLGKESSDPGVWCAVMGADCRPGQQGYVHTSGTQPLSCMFVFLSRRHSIKDKNDELPTASLWLELDCLQMRSWLPWEYLEGQGGQQSRRK